MNNKTEIIIMYGDGIAELEDRINTYLALGFKFIQLAVRGNGLYAVLERDI